MYILGDARVYAYNIHTNILLGCAEGDRAHDNVWRKDKDRAPIILYNNNASFRACTLSALFRSRRVSDISVPTGGRSSSV